MDSLAGWCIVTDHVPALDRRLDGDAVRRALPEDMEVVMKQVVRVELRPDKWEERIAVRPPEIQVRSSELFP